MEGVLQRVGDWYSFDFLFMVSVLVGTIPAHALYFGGYEVAKKNLQPERSEEEKSPWVHFVAGFWADICGSLIWVPMDVIKQRLQAQRTQDAKYKGSFRGFIQVWKEEGTRGLFKVIGGGSALTPKKKGYTAALATYGPFVGIYFAVYEQFKLAQARFFKVPSGDLPFASQLGKDNLPASSLNPE